MRELRSRKSTSETSEKATTATSSPNKNTPSSSKSVKLSRSSSQEATSSNNVEMEEEDYTEIPLFGLSELAMSGVQSEDYDDDDDEEGEILGDEPPKRKRVRNPPKHPVICPTCGKHFTRQAHLVRHLYLHTGEKPFKCSQCDQSFNRKDHLRSHVRGHSETKEFQCNHCHCNFKRQDLLRVHVLKNHGKYQKTFKPAATTKAMPHEADEINQTVPRGTKASTSFGFKILTCTSCNKKFTQEHLYRAHMTLHNKQKAQNRNNVTVSNNVNVMEANPDAVPAGEDDEYSELADEGQEYSELPDEGQEYSELPDEGQEYSELPEEGQEDSELPDEGQEDDLGEENDEDDGTNEDEGIELKSRIQQMLRNQLNQIRTSFECVVCARVFKEQRSLRRHYKLHKRQFICRFCGIRMSSAGSLMRHNLLHTGDKPFHCELCNRRFSRKDALKAHVVAHEKETTQKIQLSRPYRCQHCSARYTMRYNLIRHIRQSHPTPRNNPKMQQQIKRQVPHPPIKNEPMANEHTGMEVGEGSTKNSLKCKHCGKIFANIKSLSTHLWYHNQEKRFVCTICHHGFKYATDLNRHYLTHKDKKPTNMSQVVVQNLVVQVKQEPQNVPSPERAQATHNSIMVNGQRLYPCGVCGQIFNHRSNRSRHMRLFHKGDNPKPLPQQQQRQPPANRAIQRSFVKAAMNMRRTPVPVSSSPSPRKANIVTVTPLAAQLAQQQREARISLDSTNDNDEEQPNADGLFECEYCNKTFNKRYNYKLHMRTHNKQYVCVVCGLRTASQGDLTLHVRTHTGEKPFKCSRCDWRFCRRSALTVHYRRHHGPNAKIKRHYNPQRVTPNMMQVDGDPAVEIVTTNDGLDPDNGILKTMLENNLVKEEPEEPKPPVLKMPRKNLPPPPPLIRYPMSTPLPELKRSLTAIKAEVKQQEDEQERKSTRMFECRRCGALISGKDEYMSHMLQEHGTSVPVSAVKQVSLQSTSGPPSLQQRPKLFQKPQQQQATSCRQCGEMYLSLHDLTVHVLVAHSFENSPVTCGICRKNCSTIEFLSRHYQYVHPDVDNAAEEARLLLLNTTSYEQGDEEDDMYMENSQEETASANLLCPEVVLQEEDEVGEHENNEEMYEDYEENFPVPETMSETEESGNQELSRQSTDPNLPYPCPICNKAFKDKKALADHKWYHGREPIHPCTICGKRFKLKNDLIRHHRRHLQERPHACPEEGCDSRFYQKLDLDRHLAKVHNQLDNMPFPCEHCSVRFSQAATLVRHMRSSHPGKDISQLLIIQMHSQKKKAEEIQMQEYLENLPQDEEEQPAYDEDNMGDDKDYRLELQQLEIDMSTEEEQNEELQYEQEQASGNVENYDDVEAEGNGENLQYEEDPNAYQDQEYWLQDEQNEEEMGVGESSSSLLQPCMNKLEEYTNERGELFCKPCNKHFKDLKTLQNHVYYHQRESKHNCTHCGAKFKQKSDLRRHIGIHHDPNKQRQCIFCPNCSRSFTDERYLRIHLNRNCEGAGGANGSEDYNQDCEMPELDASTNDAGIDHTGEFEEDEADQQEEETWVEGEEPDPMMFVASALQTEADYEGGYEQDDVDDGQVDEEYEQTTFDCDICGAIFSRSNELILHKRSHAKTAKTFPFTSTSSAASSSNKKTKIFSCDKCGMSFIQKAELTQHLQTYHLDELPVHQCQFCPKYFYVKKSLDTHRRRHHSHLMNLNPCKVCGAKFSQMEYLITHQKSHHSNK